MIPILILAGLVFGRWWRTAIVLGGAYWVWQLSTSGSFFTGPGWFSVALLGAANVSAGAAVNRLIAWGFRKLPSEGRWPQQDGWTQGQSSP